MTLESPILTGAHVRLEPLSMNHLDGLVAAAAGDPALYEKALIHASLNNILNSVSVAPPAR